MALEVKELWEVLVPTMSNEGRPFRLRHHREWDKQVRRLSGGLTIMPVARGVWENGDEVYYDRMIPVRIAATYEIISQVLDIIIRHYNQEAAAAYKVSDYFLVKSKDL